jgi:hypothetical protein
MVHNGCWWEKKEKKGKHERDYLSNSPVSLQPSKHFHQQFHRSIAKRTARTTSVTAR